MWSLTQDQSDALLFAADQAGRAWIKCSFRPFFSAAASAASAASAAMAAAPPPSRQATELCKRLKRPVKVIWSREEDIAQDKQRSPNVTRLTAALCNDGLAVA